MSYQNYIFDLYGTILDIHTNESSPYLWDKMAQHYQAYGAAYERIELKNRYRFLCEQLHLEQTAEYGEIELTKVFAYLYESKGVTPSRELVLYTANTFRILSRKYLRIYPGMLQFLEELRTKGKRIYLLSNAQSSFSIAEMHQTGIHPYFDGIVMSSDVGVCKPNMDIMQHLMQKYSLKAEESIMIGNDKLCDIHLANSYGMDSLYLHTNLSPEYDESIQATYEICDGGTDFFIKTELPRIK